MGHLVEAEKALDAGEDVAALGALIEAWRATRSPRVAELVEVLSTTIDGRSPRDPLPTGRSKKAHAAVLDVAARRDPLDVPRLLGALTTATSTLGAARLEQLPEDPRVTTGLLRLIEHPPFSSQTAKPFWRKLLAMLREHGDTRAIGALEELSKDYVMRIPSSVGEWLGNQVAKTAKAMGKAHDGAPRVPEIDVLERLEARFKAQLGARRRTEKKEEQGHASEAELLDAIYEAPDDDGLRQVYRDWLLERDDPRGELIALQYAKLDGELSGAQREREAELIRKLRGRLLGPLAAAVIIERYDRGFVSDVALWGTKSAVPKTVGKPEWATVRTLHCNNWPSGRYEPDRRVAKAIDDIVLHDIMRSLRSLSGLFPKTLADYVNVKPLPLESVWVRGVQGADAAALLGETLDELPTLRHLGVELHHYESSGEALPEPILDCPSLKRLESLAVVAGSALGAWLERVDGLGLGTFSYRPASNINLRLVFTRGEDARLSDLKVQFYLYAAGYWPYPTEILLELLTGLPEGALTRFAFTPCDASAGHYNDGQGGVFVTPDAAGEAALGDALARLGVAFDKR